MIFVDLRDPRELSARAAFLAPFIVRAACSNSIDPESPSPAGVQEEQTFEFFCAAGWRSRWRPTSQPNALRRTSISTRLFRLEKGRGADRGPAKPDRRSVLRVIDDAEIGREQSLFVLVDVAWISMEVSGFRSRRSLFRSIVPSRVRLCCDRVVRASRRVHECDLIVWDSLAIVDIWRRNFPTSESGRSARKPEAARDRFAPKCTRFSGRAPTFFDHFRRDRRASPKPIETAAQADLERIEAAWANARRESGGADHPCSTASAPPTLFFRRSSRASTLTFAVSAVTNAYMRTVMAMPAWLKWRAGAEIETWVIEKWEICAFV